MKKNLLAASLAASFALAATAHATQFVTNGDFATLTNGPGNIGNGHTTATGWTTTGYNIVFSGNATTASGSSVALWDAGNGGASTWNGTAPGGINFVAMDGDYTTSPVNQTITGLSIGKVYTLSFDYGFAQQKGYSGDTLQNISASFGGSKVFTSSPNYALPSHGFSGWSTEALHLTATSTSEVLSFLAYGDKPIPPFALLTGVSLTAVPEPATWGMMIVGLGAMGAAARLRRRRASATA